MNFMIEYIVAAAVRLDLHCSQDRVAHESTPIKLDNINLNNSITFNWLHTSHFFAADFDSLICPIDEIYIHTSVGTKPMIMR